MATLAGCYGGPILFVALFFGESHDRYLLHVQAIGLLMVGGLMGWMIPLNAEMATFLGRHTRPGPVIATRLARESGD